MPPRPHWKGYLKLSLVTCPVQMTPATSESEKVRFRTLNRKTENPVVSRYIDSVTGKEVADEDEVRGYDIGHHEYVMLEDAELNNVALESTKTINIEVFTPKESIDRIWLNTPYYLSVEDPVGMDAFSVIRDAMAAENVVGISRLVISRRERAVMLEPRGKGILLWTLRYGDEVRDKSEYFGRIDSNQVIDESLPLMDELIKQRTRHWSPEMVVDPIQKKLRQMVELKRKQQMPGRIKATPGAAPQRPGVVNLMDALKKSLGSGPKKGKNTG
ncbi:Ku protein [Sinorhizobium meliloti]|nr:Ku protein [Sinorhizobium meliloti]